MQTGHLGARSTKDRWVPPGAAMGVAAGMIFIAFEMVAATFMDADFFSPLRMIGATVLGQRALDSSYPLGLVTLVGLLVCVVGGGAYGAAFGAASAAGPLRRRRGLLLVAATAFGSLIWVLNSYLLAPFIYPSFLAPNPVVQFIAYAFFYGTTLGLMLGVRYRVGLPSEPAGAGRRPLGLGITESARMTLREEAADTPAAPRAGGCDGRHARGHCGLDGRTWNRGASGYQRKDTI